MRGDDADTGGRLPYGEGTYRRRIELSGGEGRTAADLEDDFHRFRVAIEHDGVVVTGVRGDAGRYPWTSCPGALQPLEAFVGTVLALRQTQSAGGIDPRANCTHLFDLATLAISHAAAGRGRRRYDIAVTDRIDDVSRAALSRDGDEILAWQVRGSDIEGPPPYSGRSLRGRAFLDWAESSFDPDTAEAAILLRRSVFIANGRRRDLDDFASAAELLPWTGNSCHSFTEGIAEHGLRERGSGREFTHRPDALLADGSDGADP